VTVAIERRFADRAPINGDYFVSFRSILGASFLEVGPPIDDAERGRPVRNGDWVRGADPPLMDRVLIRSFQNLTASRLFVAAIAPEARRVAAAVTELSQTLRDIEPDAATYERVSASISELTDEAEKLGVLLDGSVDIDAFVDIARRADETLERLGTELATLETGIDELRADIAALGDKVPPDLRARFALVAARAATSLARLRSITADARALMAAVDRGEGTVGALLNDPEFIDDAKKLGKTLKRQPWRVLGHPGD
jgi:ABC-type transporter Mla subunit MlaD